MYKARERSGTMKKLVLLLLSVFSCAGMEHELSRAIENGESKKVEALLKQLTQAQSEATSEITELTRANLNIHQLHELAINLEEQHAETKDSLNNIDVYKRVGVGLSTIGSGIFVIGAYFYHLEHSHLGYDSPTTLSVLSAGGGMILHGAEQIRLGITNEDAIHRHARHKVISELTKKAKEQLSAPESA